MEDPVDLKTPGVYIVEMDAFPNSVVEVATAVPAFIGYTEKADNNGNGLRNLPWRISSQADFEAYFGGRAKAGFSIVDTTPGSQPSGPLTFEVSRVSVPYALYSCMRLFFDNGGGACYVVSVGSYADMIAEGDLLRGIDALLLEEEPTMVVIPEAVYLPDQASCIRVQQAALLHCGDKTKSRVAILDIYNGYRDRKDPAGDCVANFRKAIGANQLDYGAAYYPWLNTSVFGNDDATWEMALGSGLQKLLKQEGKVSQKLLSEIPSPVGHTPLEIHRALWAVSDVYKRVMAEIRRQMNLLPPSAAMAGVYSWVDAERGVWAAPANVGAASVVSPAVNISDHDQEDLNVDIQGKSINAIRAFVGEGVLVWGARTLDGNSLEWRYISVRRTVIFLEQSIRLAVRAYVFERNEAATWATVKSMIGNFLTSVWKRGGLQGAQPDDAFQVLCGLGETMTAADVLNGILRVTVMVAVTRPAEFIEMTFEQQMQTS